MAPDSRREAIDDAVAVLRRGGVDGPFDLAIVLGSGLGELVRAVENPVTIAYADIPHFPHPGVSGHPGQLVAGDFGGKRVLIFAGRAHVYEDGDAGAMHVPIGALAALGSPPLLLTNVAGAIRPDLAAMRLVLVTDHIGLGAPNPLVGEAGDERFVDMTDAYDPGFRARLRDAAGAAGIPLGEGVYMWFCGPSFETPAEIRMARTLGADLVGMSTVPEVILARRYGLRVAAISAVTNVAAGLGPAGISHGDTIAVAAAAVVSLRELVRAFLLNADV